MREWVRVKERREWVGRVYVAARKETDGLDWT
jgi:hypothetical protein